jgi:hypothetical protein
LPSVSFCVQLAKLATAGPELGTAQPQLVYIYVQIQERRRLAARQGYCADQPRREFRNVAESNLIMRSEYPRGFTNITTRIVGLTASPQALKRSRDEHLQIVLY